MKPNYGVVGSQQMVTAQRQLVKRQLNQTRGTGIQRYYQNRRERMIKTGVCLDCEGSGTKFFFFTCSSCNGSGKVSHCQACNGSGRGWFLKCGYCNGSGRVGTCNIC